MSLLSWIAPFAVLAVQGDSPGHVRLDAAAVRDDNWELRTENKSYRCVTKGMPQVKPTMVSDRELGKVLRIELEPTEGLGPDNGRDKINYTIVSGRDPEAPSAHGGASILTFSMKLDRDHFESPTRGREYVLAQWWQGAPFAPPVAMELLPTVSGSDEARIDFAIHNDQTGANPGARPIHLAIPELDQTPRGVWIKFKVETRFDPGGRGGIRVWLNNSKTPALSWKGSIGYSPEQPASSLGFHTGKVDRRPNQNVEIYVGPYRDRMMSRQVFYFGDLSYTFIR